MRSVSAHTPTSAKMLEHVHRPSEILVKADLGWYKLSDWPSNLMAIGAYYYPDRSGLHERGRLVSKYIHIIWLLASSVTTNMPYGDNHT